MTPTAYSQAVGVIFSHRVGGFAGHVDVFLSFIDGI